MGAGAGVHVAHESLAPPGAATPQVPFHFGAHDGPRLLFAQANVDEMEEKLRRWLATIPMSDGNRQWDDAQILDIVSFAREAGLHHLPAEEIYRLYVEHQVELADEGSNG